MEQEQAKAQAKPSLWTRYFLQMCVLNLLLFISFHMLVATFPYYIRDLGGDEAVAGLAAGIFSIASVVARPFVGWTLDNKSRRHTLMLGLVGMMLAPLSFTFCRVIVLAIALRMLHGVFWSVASTSSNTLVCDILPRERFGEGMGYFGLTSAISTAIAPFIGLSLMKGHGFNTLFVASAALALLSLATSLNLHPAAAPADRPHVDLKHSLKTLLNKDALPATLTIFFFLMPYGAVNTFVAMYADDTGLGLANSGIYFTFLALTTAVMRALTGRVADRKGEAPMVYAGNACLLISMLLLAFLPYRFTYMVSALFFGAGFGMMTPSMQAMAMRISPPERRGSASSTYLCGFDIGIGMGGIISGLLVHNLGYNRMFAIMMLALLASVVVYVFWARRHPSSFSYGKRETQ